MRGLFGALSVAILLAAGWVVGARSGYLPGGELLEGWITPQGPKKSRGFPQRPTPYGESLTFELTEPTEAAYGAERDLIDVEVGYAKAASAVGAIYDPSLGHAAREYAEFYADAQQMLPGGLFAFILDAAGVVGWGVRQSVLMTTQTGPRPVASLIEDMARDGMRIGVGETHVVGQPDRRVIAVLTAAPSIELLEPVEREISAGSRVTIEARLPPGYTTPELLILTPDQVFEEPEITVDGDVFTGRFNVNAGLTQVEVLALGPLGPSPLTQMSLYADEPLPETYTGRWPADETGLEDEASGRDLAFELLNADRARWDLPALIRDDTLDAIAQSHSDDMRENDFVGHWSPTTGQPADRLRRAGVRTIGRAENVALNHSIGDAQAGLMRSLGHRRNIITEDFTHVGIGAARKGASWYVTQVFTRPLTPLDDLDEAAAELLDRLNTAREAASAQPLAASDALERAALREAKQSNPTPKGALAQGGKHLHGPASAWVGKMVSLDQFEPPEALLDTRFRVVGLSVYQHFEREPPNIYVVVLVSR